MLRFQYDLLLNNHKSRQKLVANMLHRSVQALFLPVRQVNSGDIITSYPVVSEIKKKQQH